MAAVTAAAREALSRKHKAERKAANVAANAALSGLKGDERDAKLKENQAAAAALAARHADEVRALDAGEPVEGLDAGDAGDAGAGAGQGGAQALKDVPVQANGKPMTKAQLRYAKKKQEAKEAEARVAERKAAAGPTKRDQEVASVLEKLKPSGLRLREVEADGHCLYRAVADQVVQAGRGTFTADTKDPHLLLRTMCARYMAQHRQDFEPYIAPDGEGDAPLTFQQYCDRVKNTADWGGQLELRALAGALETPIKVVGADSNPIVMGEQFSGDPLTVTYHRHYLTLGEHYNSVEKAQ